MTNEILLPYALTSLQRVKDLLFDPNKTITASGNTTSGSASIATFAISAPTGAKVLVGQAISGLGIPDGTTILAVGSTSLTLSQNATATATGVALTIVDQPSSFDSVLRSKINQASRMIQKECNRQFLQQTYTNEVYSVRNPKQRYLVLRNAPVISVSSFQWRPGTVSNPNWTDFIADQWELTEPQYTPDFGPSQLVYPSGIIRVYGVLPRIYDNMIRVTYVAGYLIDFTNMGDPTKHNLPYDITKVCENIVVRWFKRRDWAGKTSMSVEQSTTTYNKDFDNDDLAILANYRRAPIVI